MSKAKKADHRPQVAQRPEASPEPIKASAANGLPPVALAVGGGVLDREVVLKLIEGVKLL